MTSSGEFYHITTRTVGDIAAFEDKDDFYRGVFSIYEFNNSKPVNIHNRRKERTTEKKRFGLDFPTLQKRDMFVEISSFSFMPNHLHLLLKQIKDNGVSNFMQKFGTGFAMYFNKKYDRKGHLFNKFKSVHIENDAQLKNTFTYIHTNLISLIEPRWKENGIKNPEKVIRFLENNKKHSYPDYIGNKNFPFVTQRDFLLKIMGGIDGCKQEINNWVLHKKELRDFLQKYGTNKL